MKKTTVLLYKWGVSRGYETAGYNTCSLWADGKRIAICKGGGYDMQGTVFAEWVETFQQRRLLRLVARRGFVAPAWNLDTKKREDAPLDKHNRSRVTLYGLTVYKTGGKLAKVSLDGGCGYESMVKVFEAIGGKVKDHAENVFVATI